MFGVGSDKRTIVAALLVVLTLGVRFAVPPCAVAFASMIGHSCTDRICRCPPGCTRHSHHRRDHERGNRIVVRHATGGARITTCQGRHDDPYESGFLAGAWLRATVLLRSAVTLSGPRLAAAVPVASPTVVLDVHLERTTPPPRG